jgi:hypothetical protein
MVEQRTPPDRVKFKTLTVSRMLTGRTPKGFREDYPLVEGSIPARKARQWFGGDAYAWLVGVKVFVPPSR